MSEYWAPPVGQPVHAEPRVSTLRPDLKAAGAIVLASVFLGAPAGLLWSAFTPHYVVRYSSEGANLDNLESTKAFIGADGSYLLVMLGVGLLCGALAWVFARKAGPYAVLALALGGVLGALIAASVGVRPGAAEALAAVRPRDRTSGSVELPLVTRFTGRTLTDKDLGLRAPWAAVGWPVGALTVFLAAGLRKPEALD